VRKSFVYSSSSWSGYWFILPALLTMLVLIAYPLLFGIYISAFDTNLLNKWNFVGLRYYAEIFSDIDFLHKIGITLQYTALVVAGNFAVGMLLAVLLSQQIKFRLLFRAILILPWLFPEVVVALLWKWMYNALYGLINHLLLSLHLIRAPIEWLDNQHFALYGVVIASIWKGYPLVMIMLLAGLQAISKDLYEAAEIDGCNKWQLFRHITVPGLMPVILVTLILETVWWFKHFTIVWLLTAGGPINATSVVSIDIYRTAFESFQFGRASAMAVIVFIICLLLSYLYRRLLSKNDH